MSENSKVLIAGATGTNGRMITSRLATVGYAVRALVRNTHSAQFLVQPNVELYEGDLNDPTGCDLNVM